MLGGQVNVEKLAHWMLSMRVRRLRIECENVEMDTAVARREISLEEELIQMVTSNTLNPILLSYLPYYFTQLFYTFIFTIYTICTSISLSYLPY
jgi:hypothetical protein